MAPTFSRTGFILYVQRYPECVAFYRDVLELKVMFATETLTCFEFGGSYLMVEPDDKEMGVSERTANQVTCLRMNVPNVREWADLVQGHGVAVDYAEHSWGTIAKFSDPDGNLCAFKDDEKFEAQVQSQML